MRKLLGEFRRCCPTHVRSVGFSLEVVGVSVELPLKGQQQQPDLGSMVPAGPLQTAILAYLDIPLRRCWCW
jgi:hypothetical protein